MAHDLNSTLLPLIIAATQILRSHPDVVSVEDTVDCKAPKLTIIHIRDWHYVDKKRFTLDVRDDSETPLSDAEVDRLFEQHRDTVAEVQKQQQNVIRSLQAKRVFHEGFVAEQLPAYKRRVAAMRKVKPYLTGDDPVDEFVRYEYAKDLLTLGAPGQLLIDGLIESVEPVEDARAYKTANPIQPDGTIVFNEKTNESREDAIVANLVKSHTVTAVLVLGGGHDLRDNVPPDVKLVEVTVKTYPQTAD